MRRNGMQQEGGLGVAGLREHLFRSLPHDRGEFEPERVVRLVEERAHLGEGVRELAAHTDVLRPLAGEEQSERHRVFSGDQNCQTIEPQVRPAPNVAERTFIPGWIVPSSSASSSATGIEAELMFP